MTSRAEDMPGHRNLRAAASRRRPGRLSVEDRRPVAGPLELVETVGGPAYPRPSTSWVDVAGQCLSQVNVCRRSMSGRTAMPTRDSIYVDGTWVASTGSDTIEVVNPATEEVVATIAAGTTEDVDRAVAAARRAFAAWSATSADKRAKYLYRLQEALTARATEVSATITTDMGAPKKIAQAVQTGLPITTLGVYANLLSTYAFEEMVGNSLVVREPIGVVGAITPWNYPLHQVVAKVAPALAAGCTIVLKPSEVAPLAVLLFADLVHEVGLPPGVFNVV